MKMTLGNRLRQAREEQDLSLRELANKLGVSAAHISDIELGNRNPSDDLLKKMADQLRVSIEELQQHDRRPPVNDMKRMIEGDPAFGLAFRTLVKKNVSAEEILDLTKRKPDRKKEK